MAANTPSDDQRARRALQVRFVEAIKEAQHRRIARTSEAGNGGTMSTELKPVSPTDAAIRKIAMEVGKQVVDHIERMHPDMVAGARSWKSSRLSIRNCAHNAIIAAVNAADRGQDEKFVADNEKHRRVLKRIRRAKSIDEIINASRSE